MKLKVVDKAKIWFSLSGFLVVVSIIFLLIWGLRPGIDFAGGSIMRLEFPKGNLSSEEIRNAVFQEEGDREKFSSLTIQELDANQIIVKLKALDETTHQEIVDRIKAKAAEVQGEGEENQEAYVQEIAFNSIGPTIGKETTKKSSEAVLLVLGAIIIYIAFAFRAVSSDVSKYESLRYGVIAIIALLHDVIITLGVFAVLGKFLNVEIDTYFIAALLTILGYSVNDTIVVFDRIRENVLKRGSSSNFDETVNQSVSEVLTRSLTTSITTLIVLFCILILGGPTTYYFILALIIGIILGTYSSIFLASPLLVWWKEGKLDFLSPKNIIKKLNLKPATKKKNKKKKPESKPKNKNKAQKADFLEEKTTNKKPKKSKKAKKNKKNRKLQNRKSKRKKRKKK